MLHIYHTGCLYRLSKLVLKYYMKTIFGFYYDYEVKLHFQDDDLSSLHPIGTAAVVVQITGTNWPKPAYTLLVTGLCRFQVVSLLQESPYPVATVKQLDKLSEDDNGKMFVNLES